MTDHFEDILEMVCILFTTPPQQREMLINQRVRYTITAAAAILLLSSCKTASINQARVQYERGEYYAASQTYRTVYAKTKRDQRTLRATIAFEMGESYNKANQTQRALNAYSNAQRHAFPDSLILLPLAQTLHKSGKYDQAEKAYTQLLAIQPQNTAALLGLQGVRMAKEWMKTPTRYKVKPASVLNSNRSEFAPAFDTDGTLYFSSSRNEARGNITSSITGVKNNDMFTTSRDAKGQWQKPKPIESDINTDYDEGTPSLSPDGNSLFYTFCPEISGVNPTAQIYVSSRVGQQWQQGRRLQIVANDTTSTFAHPAISPSGKYLYFVSDMPGGMGGKDIWRAQLGDDNSVLFVENLGSDINTSADELFPYVRNDSTIYFSTIGRPGMGGLDIFVAKYSSLTNRWSVENMRWPINSPADDLGIAFESEGEKGLFSSNRNDARGYDHLYHFELPDTHIYIEGKTTDREDQPVANATISVVAGDGSQMQLMSDGDGAYRFRAKHNTNYLMMASAKQFLNLKKSVNTAPVQTDTVYKIDFRMSPRTKPVALENIFYDFDKATLRPESKSELDELVSLLNDNPTVLIELSSHTDRKGSDEYNNELSLRRAQSVVQYLVAHGIESNRISAAGYGKTKPKIITPNLSDRYSFLNEGDILDETLLETLTPEQQTIADQLNRRTEFKVVTHTSEP